MHLLLNVLIGDSFGLLLLFDIYYTLRARTMMRESKQLRRTWSDLSDDLLRLILEKLKLVDRVRLCSVSKKFSRLLREVPCQSADKLPWLFCISFRGTWDGGSTCRLCEPFSKRSYSVRIMDREERRYLLDAIPFASSHGWILLLRRTNWLYFSLYNPYSRKFVKLPELEACVEFDSLKLPTLEPCIEFDSDGATISVDQNLPSVFYACLDKAGRMVNMSICHIGATSWKNLKFQLPADNMDVKKLKDTLYADGFVYCVLDDGCKIVTFDVVLQDWKFFSYTPHQTYLPSAYYTVFNGDLLVLHEYRGRLGASSYYSRFDKSLKQWVQQESLGELALFLGYASVFPVQAVGELSSYANTVHMPSGSDYISLITGKSQESKLYHSSDYWLHSAKYCWIEPPHST